MKVAIVTGGTSGFGFSTYEILLKKTDITSRNLARAKDASDKLKSKGGSAIPMALDLNDLSSVV